MTVERLPYQPPFAQHILKGAQQAGFGVIEDLAGPKLTGFTVAQTISENGVRQSSVRSFITPVAHRPNLHVAVNATVTKVTTFGKKATGVEMLLNGKKYIVKAKREVVLSAGTINSPQLLLLSGIGPKEHLRSVKVPVVLDLPGVGENLHNHQSYGLDFTLNEQYYPLLNESSAAQYVYNQTGPLASTGLAQVTGMLASNFTTPDDPDIQIFFAGYQASCSPKLAIADLSTYDNRMTIRSSAVNLRPTSRGRITLKDKNPLSPPLIWSNDIATEHDVNVIVDGIFAILKLANSPALKATGLTLHHKPEPACSQYKLFSKDYFKCDIRWNTRPENHQTGSCRMGADSDPMAVVDNRLKVYGIKGLRVADASVMPQVVSGNPVASVNMVGERAADFIKQDWGVATC